MFVGTRGAATSPLDTQGDVPPSDTPRLAHLRSPWAVLGIAQVGNGSGTHHSYPQHRTPGTRPPPRTAEVFPGALSWQTAQLDGQRGPVSCGTPTTLHPKPASLQYWPLSWQNAQLEKLSTARDGTLIGGPCARVPQTTPSIRPSGRRWRQTRRGGRMRAAGACKDNTTRPIMEDFRFGGNKLPSDGQRDNYRRPASHQKLGD